MSKYGQFCPVARALEILGDRWTLLIIRDMVQGTTQFNELERGLPGISRALLANRLRQLQRAGVIEKRFNSSGRQTTEYHLTQAGKELQPVIDSLMVWGEAWAFGDPTPEELDPILLMWWLRRRVAVDKLAENRIVVQFDFHGGPLGTTERSLWLILTRPDVTLCVTDPGYAIDVLIKSHLGPLFKLSRDRITYAEALRDHAVTVEGVPRFVRALPLWFGWSGTADTVSNAHVG
ncbi:MAG: helix-turn-helix transcriptional regulator [Anaerolineae bacterium]|nr:helix-turn-helix transcriptional regulator [Anaerolineae bacterium]